MSTASLTTAARQLYEALACTDDREMEIIEAAFTTYAAQVRREAIEQAARLAESMLEDAWCTGEDAPRGIVVLEAIRALPPGSPSSQTDAGDNNV